MKILITNIMMLRDKERFEQELISKGLEPVFYDVQQFFKGMNY